MFSMLNEVEWVLCEYVFLVLDMVVVRIGFSHDMKSARFSFTFCMKVKN